MRRRSSIKFVDARSEEPTDALAGTTIEVSSEGLPWGGVHVEYGHNEGWDVRELAVADHYLALNTDPVPLRFEVLRGGGSEEVELAPGAVWFCPAGESFSHRVPTAASFALVTITPGRLEQLLGGAVPRLRRRYGVVQAPLEHLVRALVAEAERGGASGPLFADAVGAALAWQLRELFATAQGLPAGRIGGLPPARLRRVLDLLEAALHEGVSVDAMAREVGLSPAHFTRAFKQATGSSPHQYLIGLRLERARAAISGGTPIGAAALAFGFADQAHFTRAFTRRFGVTPGAVAKGVARRGSNRWRAG